jgi:hypothetical protein
LIVILLNVLTNTNIVFPEAFLNKTTFEHTFYISMPLTVFEPTNIIIPVTENDSAKTIKVAVLKLTLLNLMLVNDPTDSI